jgi:hypothetical protein
MRTRWRAEADGWSTAGAVISSAENLAAIRTTVEDHGPIVVEWWHYRGASSPDRLIFEGFDAFSAWLAGTAAGDAIWVWDWAAICRDDNVVAHGKSPDESGEVPSSGAY